jgi:NTP pyrophosphatase (non-canonical NTP hydrolase)
MANTGIKKIRDLSFQELEDLVTALENMSQIADKSVMREQILKTVKKVKQEIAKRIKNL